jgi:hypothetical protein
MLAAKVDGLTVTLGTSGGRFIDGHAANGVNCHDEYYLWAMQLNLL